ncbi:MAG TPA: VWA domain-containing protein [Pyrinomonadaceae bacterium]|nr:VWA domain-containing protein [Pyrinomonadaceae bacterium]
MKRLASHAFLALLMLMSLCVPGRAQNPTRPPQQPDDVLRINTELVQTDLMVFDKQGHFVDGLQREQFELTVDGKPQPISFFEQVKAGTSRERAQLVAASNNSAPAEKTTPISDSRGRTIVFFIDDLHLSLDSLGRTRKMLERFIDQEMNDNDRVAIASTSGDIGFLQQFTDNYSVLHAAVGRLTQHPYNVRDMTDVTTPMTEYMALTIERKDDPGVLDFYIDECLRAAYPLRYKRASCEVQVKSRARLILLQAASVTLNTYAGLESLMRSSAQMAGRKLVFFISDGFLLDTGPRNADPRGKLAEITDAALRAGVVIYTIDARGLFSGLPGVTNDVPFDKQNRLESANLREGPASQDALNALAEDTGGRALRNQNYFDKWVNKILDETSNYYLLAWRPNKEEETTTTFKNIKVRVIDHPEYTVRLPRGFLKANQMLALKPAATVQVPAQPHQELQQALTAVHPKHEIPLALSVVYLDTPEHGPVLTASVRVANDALSYEAVSDKQVAKVDVVGVVINDRGKSAGTFQTRLTINSVTSNGAPQDESATIYNYRVPLAPGLYQVRIATRDNKSGQVGSVQQWIEIPDLALHRLSLSSLLLGLQNVQERGATTGGAGNPQVQFSTDHRFARNSRLNFLIFLYNAVRGESGKSKPNATIQARLLRGGQVLRTVPMRSVSAETQDLARLPFGGEIPLDSMPAGQYVIEIVATDQFARTSTSQKTKITVE